MKTPRLVGETTITAKNQVSLPAAGLRLLGWERGNRLLVEVISDEVMLLIRRPEQWTETFAGRLTDVFGTHEETLQWLEGERQSWSEE